MPPKVFNAAYCYSSKLCFQNGRIKTLNNVTTKLFDAAFRDIKTVRLFLLNELQEFYYGFRYKYYSKYAIKYINDFTSNAVNEIQFTKLDDRFSKSTTNNLN